MNPDPFFEEIKRALAPLTQAGTLQAWRLNKTNMQSYQRLYAAKEGKRLSSHQARRVDGTSYQLTVYSALDSEEDTGIATVDLVSFRPVEDQLKEAVELSLCSKNKRWSLAGLPDEPPIEVETCDPLIRDNPETVIAEVEQRFNAIFDQTTGCRLNSAELFVNYRCSEVMNSAGLSYTTEQSDLYLEAAMEKAGQENDKEVHESTTAVTLNDLAIEQFIERCALQVAVLGESEEPQTTDSAKLLIDKESLANMLLAVIQQLDCANEYNKLPFMEIGAAFGEGNGDSLHLALDPHLPFMVLSGSYTADGLVAQKGILIDKNRVINRQIGNRFGQYLDLAPNGIYGNLVVKKGRLDAAELKGQEYIEVIKFSSLLIDARKLTWSSEIKLGRHHYADGSSLLIKGGIVSGNLQENFKECHLSATEGTVNIPRSSYDDPIGYQGPDAMLITRGVSIAGKKGANQ